MLFYGQAGLYVMLFCGQAGLYVMLSTCYFGGQAGLYVILWASRVICYSVGKQVIRYSVGKQGYIRYSVGKQGYMLFNGQAGLYVILWASRVIHVILQVHTKRPFLTQLCGLDDVPLCNGCLGSFWFSI